MPERLRTIVNGLRRFVGERRRAPRHGARLRVTVSLAEQPHTSHAPRAVAGHTRDLSATGLGLVLPAIRIGERYLTGEGRRITVALELPARAITLHAAPVRYERLDEETAGESGYLIGAQITEMDPEDRAHFDEYLRGLKKS
jgi:hypothetical protein